MKKVIIIASAILIFIFLIVFILTRKNNTTNTNNQPLVAPTTVEVNYPQNFSNPDYEQITNSALPYTPYEDENFRFDYSVELNRLVVQEKTPEAKEKFIEWANQNSLYELINNPEAVTFEEFTSDSQLQDQATGSQPQTQTPDFNPVIELLNIFLNVGQGAGSSSSNYQPTTNTNSQTPATQPQGQQTNNNQSMVYYAQCDSPYADIILSESCNLCQVGCGPTTVAMIASSYVNNSYDPQKIVDIYKERGYLLSCSGTRYTDARALLQSLGLKTTDYIVFNLETADKVVNDLKKYMNEGWTFMALANFRDEPPGHFFWITDIDDQGNIWAYDVYYGRFEAPPINENSRYPYPKYRLAFGVKK